MASGGLIASKKNKEIAEEAENKSIEIKKLTSKYERINYNLLKLHASTVNICNRHTSGNYNTCFNFRYYN